MCTKKCNFILTCSQISTIIYTRRYKYISYTKHFNIKNNEFKFLIAYKEVYYSQIGKTNEGSERYED